ncbi:MAG: hypothetical protein PHD82_10750 [Candidatus Riflebacteria bacterium]|nr:hypothetical protein [Candidatus Riflebacteria bacterium]
MIDKQQVKAFLTTIESESRPGRRRAFSLLEVVVAVGLATLFSAMVFRMFSDSNSSQQRATADLNMQSRVLTSQNRIVRMVREGTDFIIPEIGEKSPALFFADFDGNIQVLYQEKDAALSKSTGKDLYKLMHYKVEVKKFNIGSPGFDPKMSRVIAENLRDISFLISNANTVNVTASFATENRDFQTMFEVGLLNSGEVE